MIRRLFSALVERGDNASYWFSRHSKPAIFVILTMAVAGAYLAFRIPIAVFPSTDFPRIVIGVDNGVMPIDQMMVTVTRPLEEAVNSVPGLQESAVDYQPRLCRDRLVLQLGH